MEEIKRFLMDNNSGALATVENGMPRVRPFGFMMEEGGRLYFCTANTKEVYKQLGEVPYVEFTSTSKDMMWIRLSGKAVFTDEIGIKQRVLDSNPMVKGLYKSADNPIFEVFYIEHGKVVFSDFSGQPPRTMEF